VLLSFTAVWFFILEKKIYNCARIKHNIQFVSSVCTLTLNVLHVVVFSPHRVHDVQIFMADDPIAWGVCHAPVPSRKNFNA